MASSEGTGDPNDTGGYGGGYGSNSNEGYNSGGDGSYDSDNTNNNTTPPAPKEYVQDTKNLDVKEARSFWGGVKDWTKATIKGLKDPEVWAKGLKKGASITGMVAKYGQSVPGLSPVAYGVTLGTLAVVEYLDPTPPEDIIENTIIDIVSHKTGKGGMFKDFITQEAKEVSRW